MIFVVVLCYVLHSGEIAHQEYVDIIIMIMSITSQKLVYFQHLYKHPMIPIIALLKSPLNTKKQHQDFLS